MTRQSFHEGLKQLNEEILRMGSMVVEAVDLSTQSLFKGDRSLANVVIAGVEFDSQGLDDYQAGI